MLCCVALAAVVVASVSGQGYRYDGTPFDGNVVVMTDATSGIRSATSWQPQPVIVVSDEGPDVLQGAFLRVGPGVPQGFPSLGLDASQGMFPVVAPALPQPVQPLPRGPLPCGFGSGSLVHETSNRREYHFSWCVRPGHTFTHQQALDYCRNLRSEGHPVGFQAISIEDQAEDAFITAIISAYHVPYIWTSAVKVGPYAWKWQTCVASRYTNWSHTGSLGHSQPDNADRDENCLGVLNNAYMDGIKWHDVSCNLEKYVICERPKAYGR